MFANVLPKWDAAESILAPGPYGSETIAYDPGSIRPYPFEPRAAALVADYTGPQAEIMPRRVLALCVVGHGEPEAPGSCLPPPLSLTRRALPVGDEPEGSEVPQVPADDRRRGTNVR